MTPAEKEAKELIEKFLYLNSTFRNPQIRVNEAKQCALICVDKILYLLNEQINKYYYEQVKQAILNYK